MVMDGYKCYTKEEIDAAYSHQTVVDELIRGMY
jgi:hypothetical protein